MGTHFDRCKSKRKAAGNRNFLRQILKVENILIRQNRTFQLVFYTTETHLCGELRAEHPPAVKYHIKAADEQFVPRGEDVYRTGKIFRECFDVKTGKLLEKQLIKENNAKLMYKLGDVQG